MLGARSCIQTESIETMVAGLVIYDRKGNDLEGRWTHQNLQGNFAREVVYDVQKDSFVGAWKVDIYVPDGALFWAGELTCERPGEAVSLRWEGAFAETGKRSSYVGIGDELPNGTIVATFEEVGP